MSVSVRTLLPMTLSLGVLGGVALALCAAFLTPGKGILIPFLLLTALTILVLRTGSGFDFKGRFLVSFGSFAIASVFLYGFTVVVAAPTTPALGHLWRAAALALIGAGLSALIALASSTSARVAGP